jgi:polyphosphate kinase 2
MGHKKDKEQKETQIKPFHRRADETHLNSDIFNKKGKLRNNIYEKELIKLQVELIKLQNWVIKNNLRVLILFEGRDAAGKGGTIKRIAEHLNPRNSRVVALMKPSDVERGQWYFQRYTKHLPDPGEIVLFDRSWYNRAGVEKVMGFCTPEEYQKFMNQVPMFEQMMVEDGILFFKYYLEITPQEQQRRIEARKTDPLKMWKLSPMDLKSIELYDEYTKAKNEMLARTHSPYSPWILVDSNDKKRARINIIKDILSHVNYDGKEDAEISLASDPTIVKLYTHLMQY